ncbi:aminotransferase class I/II-fold pyridoxal phosphate-dependent enzyme [Leeuwenhoekiella sp. A16]|uniref:aminotransferase class I/II-fold pyridoxal phosphate-dependent enzyme n=1 Tax=Leeuwenhoekiella sp. A16 TaxID=3141462 RepID=UPI003A805A69
MLPQKLQAKLDKRTESNSLRALTHQSKLIDFSSNDYLGFAKSESIFREASAILESSGLKTNGATGSRLLSGNHKLYDEAENLLCGFHKTEAALIFNSGYDANVGFFGSVPQRGDVILYDEFIHASIRDGMRQSLAKSYKCKHNDLADFERLCQVERSRNQLNTEMYIVTESVFSMDGDSPDLEQLVFLCEKYKAPLIVDEAHAVGVFGKNGEGLIQQLGLENKVFARLVTFGKALGCHGAAILGSEQLKKYLVNFARSLIYTTALAPHAVATIISSYNQLYRPDNEIIALKKLPENIQFFIKKTDFLGLKSRFIAGKSAIQSAVIPGNSNVKMLSRKLNEAGFDVKPILSPTVPAGQERLRFCLHSYNTEQEISTVLKLLAELVNNFPA